MNEFGFTGYYLDAESGLYYARARMYSAGLGRFVSRDPLGYIDGSSLYAGYFAPNKLDYSGTAAGDITAGPPLYGTPGYEVEFLWEFPANKPKNVSQAWLVTVATWVGINSKCEVISGSDLKSDVVNLGPNESILMDTSRSTFPKDACVILEIKVKTFGFPAPASALQPPGVNVVITPNVGTGMLQAMHGPSSKTKTMIYRYYDWEKCKCCPIKFKKLEELTIQ